MRYQTLMVRSASEFIVGPRFARTRWRVSNHETGLLTSEEEERSPPSKHLLLGPRQRKSVAVGIEAGDA